jgi:hypothetical protein
MSTAAQIKANRENAKLSTGPTTQAGSERSSRNAVRHGYTGQTLVLTPEEGESYAAHVALYMEITKPIDDFHRNLVQQLADADWGVHQIFTAQTAQVSLMNVLTLQLSMEGADVAAIIKSSAQCARTLATLSTYENRKRRIAKLLREQLGELQNLNQEEANSNETKPEPEIGFVHPDAPKPPSPDKFERLNNEAEALLDRLDAGVTPEEAAEIYKKLDMIL